MTEYNYTRIATYITHTATEDCPSCNESYDEYYTHCWSENECECTCGGNPQGYAIVTCVRVAQKPIITRPPDTDFDVIGWKIECRENDTHNVHTLINTSNPDHRFCIPSVIDPVDLETENAKLVYKYVRTQKDTKSYPSTGKKFRAPCGVESYMKELDRRVDIILNPPRQREKNKNPHVSRRKKKH